MLFFPDQHLEPDAHRAFATRFGQVEIHLFITKLDDDHPEIIVLDSDNGGRRRMGDTDVTFSLSPRSARCCR